MGILKNIGWVLGKTLQGAAYVTSGIVKEATGMDFYGSIKDAINNGGNLDDLFCDLENQSAEKKEEIRKKRVKFLRDNISKCSNEQIQKMVTDKKILFYEELDILQMEAMKRNISLNDIDELQLQ